MTVSTSPKVAVLINGVSKYRSKVKASFTSAITTISPSSIVDFYDPIEAQTYPDPAKYDLIVLSGGTVDPMGQEPWVLKMREFLRETVREFPRKKIVGICWGHQTISVAFGGVVEYMEKAEIGVTPIPLTPTGSSFFTSILPDNPTASINLHEYHKRIVKTPGKGFIALGENNQCFVNADNTILTFQGHPEMTEALGKEMLGNTPAYMGVGEEEKVAIAKRMESGHDGLGVWRRVLQWVGE